jgi:hypothetical protein
VADVVLRLTREEAERVESILEGPHGHTLRTPERGYPPCLACDARDKLRASLDSPAVEERIYLAKEDARLLLTDRGPLSGTELLDRESLICRLRSFAFDKEDDHAEVDS